MPNPSEIPPVVARFREKARAEIFPARYSGPLHVLFTSGGSLGAMAFALSRVEGLQGIELLTVPATFLIANLGEYFGHRGPMHHLRSGFGRLHRRHVGEHHRFFTAEAMYYASSRDFYMVLFPPVLQIFFLRVVVPPLALLVFWLFTANAGWLFVATVVAYYFTYELLHFNHHLPPQGWLGRQRLLARLREHHMLHHDPRFMQRANFNITFPICDWLSGTIGRAAEGPPGLDALERAPEGEGGLRIDG